MQLPKETHIVQERFKSLWLQAEDLKAPGFFATAARQGQEIYKKRADLGSEQLFKKVATENRVWISQIKFKIE